MSGIRLYRPGNGTEGEWFMSKFCYRCVKDVDSSCEILFRTFGFEIDDPEYPQEWCYVDGNPTCTAFEIDELAAVRRAKEEEAEKIVGEIRAFIENVDSFLAEIEEEKNEG